MKQKIPVQVIFREYFEGIVAAVVLALFLRFFVFSVLYIPSGNMETGLRQGDFIIGWKLVYGFPIPLQGGERLNPKHPNRGDIVAFRFPGDEEQILVRRVVGLPGETLSIREGKIEVNGQVAHYTEEYDKIFEEWSQEKKKYPVKAPLAGNLDSFVVPPDHFFVMTDNRARTDDSRSWGAVPFKNIESRMQYIWLSVSHNEDGLKIHWDRLLKTIK